MRRPTHILFDDDARPRQVATQPRHDDTFTRPQQQGDDARTGPAHTADLDQLDQLCEELTGRDAVAKQSIDRLPQVSPIKPPPCSTGPWSKASHCPFPLKARARVRRGRHPIHSWPPDERDVGRRIDGDDDTRRRLIPTWLAYKPESYKSRLYTETQRHVACKERG